MPFPQGTARRLIWVPLQESCFFSPADLLNHLVISKEFVNICYTWG